MPADADVGCMAHTSGCSAFRVSGALFDCSQQGVSLGVMRNRCVGQPRHVLLPLAPPAPRIATGEPGPCLLPRAMAVRSWPPAIRGSAEHEVSPSTWTQASIVDALPVTPQQRNVLLKERQAVIEHAPPPKPCTVEHAFLYVNLCSNPNHSSRRVRLVRLLLGNGMDDGGLQDTANKQGWLASGPVMFDSELVHGYWSFAADGGFHWWVDWGQTGDEHTIFSRLVPREPFQCYGTWPILGPWYRGAPVRDEYAVRVWGTGLGTRVSDSLM